MIDTGTLYAPGGYYGEAPARRDGCAVDCPAPVGGDHLPECVELDDEPDALAVAIFPGACNGTGQTSFGPELAQPCPVCGRQVLTVADPVGRRLVAHVAPEFHGEAPSVSLDL